MVDFSETVLLILGVVVPAAFALARGLLELGLNWLKTKTPFYFLVPEAEVREAVDEAIQYGVNYAAAKVRETNLTVKVDNRFILLAVEYVKARVPQSLTRFGITDEALEEMVKARLPKSI